MTGQLLRCKGDERRALVRADKNLNGLDYLEVSPDQRSLTVYFLDKAPADLELGNLRVTGGRQVTGIKVTAFAVCTNQDPERDDCLVVDLDRPGDFSCYRLEVVVADAHGRPTNVRHPRFDPRYYGLDFSFKVDCYSDLDCAPAPCPPEAWPRPDIRYLAKDFQSFLDLLLDRMAVLLPAWRERSLPDLYLTLLELLAYVGDQLSYQQDAIATEAYLATARLRTSVRRHARLVDYRMHEGCSARVWIVVESQRSLDFDASSIGFVTNLSVLLPGTPPMIKPSALERLPQDGYLWFQPVAVGPLHINGARSTIEFYTWGDTQCCLPAGATAATLVDEVDDEGASKLELAPGVVLMFEEVMGPITGIPGDADPAHRHPVRLTDVQHAVDPLTGIAVLEICWAASDALPFALCLSAIGQPPDCAPLDRISVAYGNVFLADHGRTCTEELGDVPTASSVPPCADGCPDRPVVQAGRFSPELSQAPLSYQAPVDLTGPAALGQSVDARKALPQVTITSRNGQGALLVWRAQPDLLASTPGDRHFVVEVDDESIAHVRFGDDTLGRAPAAGEEFSASYRVGSGSVGNVGPNSIAHLVSDRLVEGAGIKVHNPLPAFGGTAPEEVADVKRFAPTAIHRDRERAITAADYAELAMRDFPHDLQRTAAELRWTGSWYEARVAVDSTGSFESSVALLGCIASQLERYRRIGHDIAVVAAAEVGLDVAIQICVGDGYRRSDVERAVLARLGNRILADGSLGMFHPDAVTFGTAIAVSSLVAAVASIPGVNSARVVRLRRYGEVDVPPLDELDLPADGLLTFRANEIPRLDNDPSAPEHGVLCLDLGDER
jgi:hypothetical protein